MRLLFAALVLWAGAALSEPWHEPARGTALRADLLDALRPVAEWWLGPPVAFVVEDLRVDGDVAFANLRAQRPGGHAVDMATTPLVQHSGDDPGMYDGAIVQALMQRSGRMWVATLHAIGPTDVWYAAPEFCPVWGNVIPEVCP